jgi:hypothetical protein
MKNDIIPDIFGGSGVQRARGGSGVQRAGGKTGSGCRIILGATTKYI